GLGIIEIGRVLWLSRLFYLSREFRRPGIAIVLRGLEEAYGDKRNRCDLQDAPGHSHAWSFSGSAIVDDQRQNRTRNHAPQVRRVINVAAQHVSDEKIQNNHRQQAGAKGALKPFRQLVAKLDAKNKKNSTQSEQCARSSRRWRVVGLKNETSDRIAGQT